MILTISNRDARRLWLNAQGLANPAPGDLIDTVKRVGFVQLDTVRVVARAHHHILWTRDNRYREPMLRKLLADDRSVFEHFTHDASVIPMEFYPFWRRQFGRMDARVKKSNWGKIMPGPRERKKILMRIEREGPLSSRDFVSKTDKLKDGWIRPPHKFALDYMWYSGVLATAHRKNFVKFYDLRERVIPEGTHRDVREDAVQIDWLCNAALERLAFASAGELQRFWEATDLAEVKDWIAQQGKQLIPVKIGATNGGHIDALAFSDIEERLAGAQPVTSRLRIINPFDPIVRDRTRLKRLFGFDYRIEIFTPAAKRAYGYYVYPIIEGDRFIGRIEIRSNRKTATLTIENLWPEAGVRQSKIRMKKLDAELSRLGRFVGARTIVWQCRKAWAPTSV